MSVSQNYRPEIQGLRAFAVILVVVYHVAPEWLQGGYVGVDVFFVISGFLITGLLLREIESTGSIAVIDFYKRRMRRLFPVAMVVLLVVLLFTPVILPKSLWEDTAFEVLASALYFENWRLAWLSTDYLGSENPPSPVQHFWSLSVEEQFYILWPILMVIGVASPIGRKFRVKNVLAFILLTITLTSFLASVFVTKSSPEEAYFVTHTRLWELALGGLLAFIRLPVPTPIQAESMRLVGFMAILGSAFLYSKGTAFPGYAALLPTLGSVAIILAGDRGARISLYSVLSNRVSTYVGDISYSIYLWHWPVIVFWKGQYGSSLNISDIVFIVFITFTLSSLSKAYVEDVFRHKSGYRRRFLPAASLLVLLCFFGSLAVYTSASYSRTSEFSTDRSYPGPSEILEGVSAPEVELFMPIDKASWRDLPAAYSKKCHLNIESTDLNPCLFGEKQAETKVFLVGDSHAANWIPALSSLADTYGWYVETHTKSGCPVLVKSVRLRGKPYEECRIWGEKVLERIKKNSPDIIVTSMSAGAKLFDKEYPMNKALIDTWFLMSRFANKVVVIADTPKHNVRPADCIEENPGCSSPRNKVMRSDSLVSAANSVDYVQLIDMTDTVCTSTQCPMVIGNVVVWRDTHHLTATYSRMLAPYLHKRIFNR